MYTAIGIVNIVRHAESGVEFTIWESKGSIATEIQPQDEEKSNSSG